jgi:lysophospholipase L1-like esterase
MKNIAISIFASVVLIACGGGGSTPQVSTVSTVTPVVQTPVVTPVTPVSIDPIPTPQASFSKIQLSLSEKTLIGAQINGSKIIYRETVLPYRSNIQLSHSVQTIKRVENLVSGAVYTTNDYSVVNGNLVINPSGSIPLLNANFTSTIVTTSPYAAQSYNKDGSPLHLAWDYFQNQIEVTYTTDKVTDYLDAAKPLPRLSSLIANKKQVTINFVGDEITVGGDSSANLGLSPNQKPWNQLVTGWLSESGSNVLYRNVATSGMPSSYGADTTKTDLNVASDVLVIAYGMNDQAASMPVTQFMSNISSMVSKMKAINPDVEIILVSGFKPNVNWMYSNASFIDQYKTAMQAFVVEQAKLGTNVVVADVTAETDRILQSKSFFDITSNGVNHPNDFFHMVYAQTILYKIGML